MTPNLNPSPEAIMCGGCGETNSEKRCMGCMHDFGTPESAWVQKYATAPPVALSPQTLPAPGDVERKRNSLANVYRNLNMMTTVAEIERGDWDHTPEIASLATVAAANDEGVRKAIETAAHRIYDACRPDHPLPYDVCEKLATTANDEAFARGVEAAAKVADDYALGAHEGAEPLVEATAETIAAAIRLLSQGGGKAERYRHVKRGTVYEVVGRAQLQIATGDVCEGSELVIYRGDDGKLWARESGEFNDGRFEPLATSRSQHEGAE